MPSFFARAALAELLVVEALLASYVAGRRLLPRETSITRWVGVLTCLAILASIEFHVLRVVGAFHLSGALLLQTLVTATALKLAASPQDLRRWLARDAHFVRALRRRHRRSPFRWVAVAFAALSLPIVLRPLLLPPMGWDTLTYHAVKAAMWVQNAGTLPMNGPGTWAFYAPIWAGGEVFTAWAMLPFHSDLLAMAVDAAEWLALGLALFALARELGIPEPAGSAAVGFALAIPTLRISVGSGYVEVALLWMIISAWAMAGRFLQRGSLGAYYLAAGAAGVAAGIKFTFLPASLLTLAALAAGMMAHPSPPRGRLLHLAAGAGLFAVILLPWLWATVQLTGLPFSPFPVKLLGVSLGRTPPEVELYVFRPDLEAASPSELALLLRSLFEERMGPGMTTMIAVGASLAAWPLLWRRHARLVLFLGLAIVASWLTFFVPGLSVARRFFSSSAVRYLLPALVPSVVLSAGLCRARSRLGRVYLLFLIAGSFFQLLLYLPYGWSSACAAGLALLIVTFGLVGFVGRQVFRSLRPGPFRFAALAATGVVALFCLGEIRDELRFDLYRRDFVIHPFHRYWLDAARALDSPAQKHRIAITSGPHEDLDNWLVYPFLGRALQNDVVYVPPSRDGAVHHFGRSDANAEYARSADFASWKSRLLERGVTDVVSFRPASVELGWMESHPQQFQRRAGDAGDWGVFAVVESP